MGIGMYVLRGQKPAAETDALKWAAWFEGANRIVRTETVVAPEGGGTKVTVSTVFLGLDQSAGVGPPLLFEGAIFGGRLAGERALCSTWKDALQMHERMVQRVRSSWVLATLPADLLAYMERHLKQERAELNGFLPLGNEIGRAKLYDGWIAALKAHNGALLTPWFSPDQRPVRDGVYLVREIRLAGLSGTPVRSDSWHACRWDCHSRAWYSAGSIGRSAMDLIGMDRLNSRGFEWRGLAAPAGE